MRTVASGVSVAQPAQANLALGIAGAVVSGFLGMAGWYLLIKTTGYEIGYAAWGVGVLTGIGTSFLARGKTPALGVVAGICALLAILGGQYLATQSQVNESINQHLEEAYQKSLAYAQEATKADTDDAIRLLIAKDQAKEGAAPNPGAVTAQQIADFHEKQVPKMQAFIKGKPTKEEYAATYRKFLKTIITPGQVMKESIGIFTLLWIFLGVGSAHRLASK